MIDMQLLNNALVAIAILVGVAVTISAAIVAVAAITGRRQTRHGGSGGSGTALPKRPAPATEDARTLVLR
jgi:hypothetical protein